MQHSYSYWEKLVKLVLVLVANRVSITEQHGETTAAVNGTIPALFAFGDSILDTGNNNNLITLIKCNFPPYGKDFMGGKPTGRFCDGRIPSDMIAEGLGIKQNLPAYADPNIQSEDFISGVCFASGGSGNDDLTATILRVLPLSAQLHNFKAYKAKLRELVGDERANSIISNGLYLFSAGNNDVAVTYTATRNFQYDFPTYSNLLVSWSSSFLKDLYEVGARRVWVLSTLPLGCLPEIRFIFGGLTRQCAETVNKEAQLFNSKLASELVSIKRSLVDYELDFIDVYTPLLDLIQNPQKSGFVDVTMGCCGTGTIEIAALCNQLIPFTCSSPSKFVFWDSGHPTQAAYEHIVADVLQKHKFFN